MNQVHQFTVFVMFCSVRYEPGPSIHRVCYVLSVRYEPGPLIHRVCYVLSVRYEPGPLIHRVCYVLSVRYTEFSVNSQNIAFVK